MVVLWLEVETAKVINHSSSANRAQPNGLNVFVLFLDLFFRAEHYSPFLSFYTTALAANIDGELLNAHRTSILSTRSGKTMSSARRLQL